MGARLAERGFNRKQRRFPLARLNRARVFVYLSVKRQGEFDWFLADVYNQGRLPYGENDSFNRLKLDVRP